ncbi:MAG: outer membrane protein assembly factor BamA [Caulobacterales bacterium]
MLSFATGAGERQSIEGAMNRVLRDVVFGAVTSVAAVSVSATALLAGVAEAQTAAQPATPAQAGQGVIRRVVVEGNQRIEPSTITSYMSVRAGDRFDPEQIDLSLKTLFATNLFADVKIEQRDQDLVVTVIENPIINRVIFEGLNSLKEDDLADEVQARPRAVFTPARAQSDVQRIIEVYRRSGRFAASVTPQVRELDQNRVDLIFEIDEGPVTGVRDINFIGNREFSDGRLRDAIVTTESHWWNFFSKNDNYDPDRLEYDREQLRQFYTNRGYADFRVVSAVAELTPDQKDFYITFTVDEGEKYEFGNVRVETALDRVSADALRAAIPIREGDLFKGDLIEDSIDAMSFVAGTSGYANVDIRPRIERNRETKKVDVVFEVNEGPRVFIERIDIVGNTRTVDEVIRREMRIAEGDAFNRVLLDRSKSRVRALGFFKDVTVEEQPGSAPDRSVVRVNVEEEPTGELAFAAGYSSSDSFLFDVSVSERNLRGRGQFLRFRISTSAQRQQVDIRFTEPRFLGRELAAGFDLYSLRTDFLDQSSFENQSTGLGLRTSFPLTEHTGLGITYNLIHDDTEIADGFISYDDDNNPLTDNIVVERCDPSPVRERVCDQEGTFLTSVLGYQFNWDRKNDPVTPTGGFDLSLSQDLAGLGGDVHYLRTELRGGAYLGLFQGVTASFRGSAGYIFGWGGDEIRINDRFFKGGASFRGFDVAGIGPRVITEDTTTTGEVSRSAGDALGGNLYAIGTIEVTFPLGLPESFGLSSAAFVDFGGLGMLDDGAKTPSAAYGIGGGVIRRNIVEDNFALRAAAGLSLYWDSPFGPVQFDFAQPIQSEDYDDEEAFRFSTRTRF